MFRNSILALGAITALTACSAEIKFPAASIMQFQNDGTEWVMTGEMFGNINGNSRFTLIGSGVSCQGTTTVQEDGDSLAKTFCTLSDGAQSEFTQIIPKEQVTMSFSGASVSTFDSPLGPVRSAFGWGNKADPEFLRSLLN